MLKTKLNLRNVVAIAICLAAMTIFVSCEKNPSVEVDTPQVSDVTFTECQQNAQIQVQRNVLDAVDVEFTNQGVQIMYHDFAVTCDFTTIDVTYTFVNGFLNITQQGSPNQANCVCYTDVSYTITGISKNEVNVIFINGEQVYCHNGQLENLLVGKWLKVASDYNSYHNDTIHFTADMRVEDYFIFMNNAMYPESSYYFTYSLTENAIKITSHQPENAEFSEIFEYVLNDNSLIIKGFSNPFSLTAEVRCDVHFTRIEENSNPTISDGNVLMLKVDYLTNTFEGGYEFSFNNVPNNFTVVKEYMSPGDFGYVKYFYDEINEMLFYGTIIWMGEGQIYYPENILPASAFDLTSWTDIIYPNGFENIGEQYNPNMDYTNVWLSVQNLAKVRYYLVTNPNQTVKIFLYMPCVGVGDPAHWDWILFLKK